MLYSAYMVSKPRPKNPTKTVMVREIPVSLWLRVKSAAGGSGVTVQQYVRAALEAAVGRAR